MAAVNIFEEDLVVLKTENDLKCALVLETHAEDSSDESDDDNEFVQSVKKGSVRLAWHPSGDEEVVEEKNITLADRSLMPGDIVRCLVAGQDSQRGYVQSTQVDCHLQILGENKIIESADSKDLKPQREWVSSAYDVYMDSWVGKIVRCDNTVTFVFQDNAKCSIDENVIGEVGRSGLEDVAEKRDFCSEFVNVEYYTGQLLRGPLGVFEGCKWHKSTKRHCSRAVKKYGERDILVKVTEVKPKSVEVYWLSRGYGKADTGPMETPSPPQIVTGDDLNRLKKLNCFEPSSIQIGDKAFYQLKSTDTIKDIPPKLKHGILNFTQLPTNVKQGNGEKHTSKCVNNNSSNSEYVCRDDECAANTNNCSKSDSCHGNSTGSSSAHKASLDKLVIKKSSQGSRVDSDCENLNCADDVDESDEMESEDLNPDSKSNRDLESDSDGGSSSSGASSASSGSISKKKSVSRKVRLLKAKWKQQKNKKPVPSHMGRHKFEPGDLIPVEVIYTNSHIDVVWQDGSLERSIPSASLYPMHHLDDLEFFPGDFVVPADSDNVNLYGVVQSANHTSRTCVVTWFKVGADAVPEKCGDPEELSVYDIKDHTDYKYRPGQLVLRVGGYKGDDCVFGGGQVFDYGTNGRILVKWPDGSQSYMYPQELYIADSELSDIAGSDSDSSTTDDSSSDGSEESWETEDEEELDEEEAEEESKKAKAESSSECPEEEKATIQKHKSLLKSASSVVESFVRLYEHDVLNPVFCCEGLLDVFESCKQIDINLNTSHSRNEDVKESIRALKKLLKSYRLEHLMNKVKLKFEANVSNSAMSGDKTASEDMLLENGDSGFQNECVNGAVMSDIASSSPANKAAGDPGIEISNMEHNQDKMVTNADTDTMVTSDETMVTTTSNVTNAESMQMSSEKQSMLIDSIEAVQAMEYDIRGACASDIVTEADSELDKIDPDNITSLEKQLEQYSNTMLPSESSICDQHVVKPNKTKNPVLKDTFKVLDKLIKNISDHLEDAVLQTGSGPDLNVKTKEKAPGSNIKTKDNETAQGSNVKTVDKDHKTMSEHENNPYSDKKSVSNCDSKSQTEVSSHTDNKRKHRDITEERVRNDNVKSTQNDHIETDSAQIVENKLDHMKENSKENIDSNKNESVQENGADDSADEQEGNNVKENTITKLDSDKENVNSVDKENVNSVKNTKLNLDIPLVPTPKLSATHGLPTPGTPGSPFEFQEKVKFNEEGFKVEDELHIGHHFRVTSHAPNDSRAFLTTLKKEIKSLSHSLPYGIYVKGFLDRMDLFSVMIQGPTKTPYEDGLFFFDVQLPNDYPTSPPRLHYISYCSDRLNPNLYQDGKVCVSLLGTWSGKGTEIWTSKSSLLQVLISLQGLILNREPYFNEAGYERQRGTQVGIENSRMYNEMVVVKMVQSMTRLTLNPPQVFEKEAVDHIRQYSFKMIHRMEHWITIDDDTSMEIDGATASPHTADPEASAPVSNNMDTSEQKQNLDDSIDLETMPEFPLLPVSKGLKLSLKKALGEFKSALSSIGIVDTKTASET